MKTVHSTMFRNIANPRRTTLAHLKDADGVQAAPEQPQHAVELPTQTANPKRTVLMVAPEPADSSAA
ncbi:FXSXX-COOH protein OS=Streptomyces alboniger OX=132473 GN=CP975_25560 PE=4 SV=1 [Streptomyces alboniger]